jgi:hypothetical protein
MRRHKVEKRDSVKPVLSVEKVARQCLARLKYKGR